MLFSHKVSFSSRRKCVRQAIRSPFNQPWSPRNEIIGSFLFHYFFKNNYAFKRWFEKEIRRHGMHCRHMLKWSSKAKLWDCCCLINLSLPHSDETTKKEWLVRFLVSSDLVDPNNVSSSLELWHHLPPEKCNHDYVSDLGCGSVIYVKQISCTKTCIIMHP